MARKMSPEDYQELGRRYYKLKQYDKAIETLTQGIEAMPTLGLYDHRAASYDKLEDFNAAVKDGREMIKFDKTEVKGYLRTASVLEKMEKPDTALGIYKYGMKNIPTSDKNFKLLHQLHDKLTRKLSPPQAIDPFTIFPVELAEMILSYLNFRQMVNCMRVSKGWRDYLAKFPSLWMHIDLSGARRVVRRSFVAQAVRRSEDRLTRFTMHRFDDVDVLKNIAKACKSLEELKIITLPYNASSSLIEVAQSAVNLKKLIILPELSVDTMTQILRHRPDLEHVEYHGVKSSRHPTDWKGPFPALKHFRVESVEPRSVQALGVVDILRQAPSLESLTLTNMTRLSDFWPGHLFAYPPLKDVRLFNVDSEFFPALPSTVQTLHIIHSGKGLTISTQAILPIRLPELTTLHLQGLTFSTVSLFYLLDHHFHDTLNDESQGSQIIPLKNAKPLESLSIRGVIEEPEGLFTSKFGLIGSSSRTLTPALRSLDVAGMPCDDDEIEILLTNDLALESIDLSNTQITGASIKMLADKLPTLRVIKANQCMKINGRDAIHYAERKGINVSYRLEELKGWRRIRY